MAKRQSFAEKSSKKAQTVDCPVCKATFQYIRHVKAVKTDSGAWKYKSRNMGVCKCNQKEVYG